jgi:hypothetical protein
MAYEVVIVPRGKAPPIDEVPPRRVTPPSLHDSRADCAYP